MTGSFAVINQITLQQAEPLAQKPYNGLLRTYLGVVRHTGHFFAVTTELTHQTETMGPPTFCHGLALDKSRLAKAELDSCWNWASPDLPVVLWPLLFK